MSETPPYGLLLDVDGPLASPRTRTLAQPGLVGSLLRLLAGGIPVVFNTGRSDGFLREQVVAPLARAGVPAGARLHAVCEKGAVWATAGPAGLGQVHVDETLAVPATYRVAAEELVTARYGDVAFVDRTKRAMVSVEQRVDVPREVFAARQAALDADALDLFAAFGLGARLGERVVPGPDGRVDYRVDPTIIATDMESVRVGKDLGARRALELLSADGALPRAWHTLGDSRTDYAMADWLAEEGHDVVHVDVRPSDGVLARDYPVVTVVPGAPPGAEEDAVGAAYLAGLAGALR